jgi:hypothetical protein
MNRRSALLGLAGAALDRPALAQAGWTQLLDGKTLDAWTPVGAANWSVVDGAAQADKGSGLLVSKASYGDFELRAEFWVDADANSGIFIRCSDPANVTPQNAYEVNIFDKRPDPTYGTGAIVDLAKVSPMPEAGGRWNVMEVTAKGPEFSVVFNGVRTVDKARDDKRARGPIALQRGSGVVKFRKVAIRPL